MSKKFALYVGVIFLAAVLIFSCSDGEGPSGDTGKTEEEKALSEAEEVKQPINLRIGHVTNAANHFGWQDMGTYLYRATVYQESLVGMDRDGDFTPRLAKRWETEDSKKWTFYLVENAVWHDGEPFTARDVVFTVEYTLEKKPWGMNDAKFMEQIENISMPDDYTVVIEMETPYANLLNNIRIGLVVVPEHIYKNVDDPMQYGDPETELDATIGTGPYKVVSMDTTSRTLKFTANKEYYAGAPAIDEMTIRYYGNSDTMIMGLLKGEIDTTFGWGSGIDYFNVPKILSAEHLDITLNPSLGLHTLAFNNNKPPFDNKKLREAVAYCLDYEKLKNLVQGGYGEVPNRGLVPKGVPHFVETPGLKRDLEMAAGLLDEIGFTDRSGDGWRQYPDGSVFRPQLLTNARGWRAVATELVAEDLKNIGINVDVKVSPSFGAERRDRAYDLIMSGTSAAGMFAWEGYYTIDIDGNAGLGNAQVFDPQFMDLVEGLREAVPSEKAQAAKAVQSYYSENLPAVALYWSHIIQPYNNEYTGWGYDPGFGTIMCYDTFFNVKRTED